MQHVNSKYTYWFFIVLIVCICMCVSDYSLASDGEQLAESATTLEKLLKGNGGKLALLAGLIIAVVLVLFKKDWAPFVSVIVLCFGIVLVIGMISGSFTALI